MDRQRAARERILPATREEALRLFVKHTGGNCAPNSVPSAEDLAAASNVLKAKCEADIEWHRINGSPEYIIKALEAGAAGFANNPFK